MIRIKCRRSLDGLCKEQVTEIYHRNNAKLGLCLALDKLKLLIFFVFLVQHGIGTTCNYGKRNETQKLIMQTVVSNLNILKSNNLLMYI